VRSVPRPRSVRRAGDQGCAGYDNKDSGNCSAREWEAAASQHLHPNIPGWLKCAMGFVDINAMALNAAVEGSILADPEACLVTRMAFPFGSRPPPHQAQTAVTEGLVSEPGETSQASCSIEGAVEAEFAWQPGLVVATQVRSSTLPRLGNHAAYSAMVRAVLRR
jgi:hypothetical protein